MSTTDDMLPEPNRYVKFAILSNHFETCTGECPICTKYSEIYQQFHALFFELLAKGKRETP